MIQKSTLQRKSQDIKTLCNIACSLLGLEPGRVRGTMGCLAKNFMNAPSDATVDDLLQVSSETRNHIRHLADNKLFSMNSLRNMQYHNVYVPLISFVPSMGSRKMILGDSLRVIE